MIELSNIWIDTVKAAVAQFTESQDFINSKYDNLTKEYNNVLLTKNQQKQAIIKLNKNAVELKKNAIMTN